MRDKLEAQYCRHLPLLESVRHALHAETEDCLKGMHHIDRVGFRVKGVTSFLEKALDPLNDPPYEAPLREIEDQIAGRVIVFSLNDIDPVRARLEKRFRAVESSARRPQRDEEFGYESHHLICRIPVEIKPREWVDVDELPATFELQVRTLFMHAWAEPQHDLGYKGPVDLPREIRRELAWIAASAWGADKALNRVFEWFERQKDHVPVDDQRSPVAEDG